MFRRFLAIILSAMIILSIPVASSSAADNEIKVELKNGSFECEFSEGITDIKFELEKDCVAFFRSSDFDCKYEVRYGKEDKRSYINCDSSFSTTRFLTAGEVTVHMNATKKGTFTFTAFQGSFKYTENGVTKDVRTMDDSSYIGLNGCEETTITLEVPAGISFDELTWEYKDSEGKKVTTSGNQVTIEKDNSVSLYIEQGEAYFNFLFFVYRVGELKIQNDHPLASLVDKGTTVSYTPDVYPVHRKGNFTCYKRLKQGTQALYQNDANEFDMLVDDYASVEIRAYTKGGPELVSINYFFVKGINEVSELPINNDIRLENMQRNEQRVFSFTPEKDGKICIKTDDDAYELVLGVFDENDKFVGFYENDINPYDEGMDKPLYEYLWEHDMIDYRLNFSAELKAGKTYYFYFAENYGKRSYTVKVDFDDGSKSSEELSFNDFVERLYVVALNRQSEKDGKDYWCNLVGNGTLTGADCARFFLTSPEFKGRNLSDEDFLKVLYKTFFDRDAKDDPDGFNFWMNSLKTVGKDTVVEGFINSPEWCNICADYGVKSGAPTAKATKASKNATAFATRLYTECLGREPEEGGLKYWSLGLTNCELSGSQAAHEFFYCQEFNDHNFDNKELLTRMYRTFMGREPDTDGLNYWLSNMNNGMTKDQVFNSFVQSQEFTEICANYAITR